MVDWIWVRYWDKFWVADHPVRLVLASASPARLTTLTQAGLHPTVMVSAVDEDAFTAPDVPGLAAVLARAKAEAVADTLPGGEYLVVGCDSLLEFEGQAHGKPGDAATAVARWRSMRGRTGRLHTGHHVIRLGADGREALTRIATTEVTFADLSDAEIEAYVATGEPLQVAGAFTIDSLGGPFVASLTGDPHNVVGISLPLLRVMFCELGVSWPQLWAK